MADKPLQVVNGLVTQVEATVSSAGAANAGDIVALDSAGKLDQSVMPTGIGADTLSVVSSENLTAGNFVNIYDDAGTAKVRKADATDATKPAVGFVKDNVTAPAAATVYFEGSNTALTGLTAGTRMYLATTPGTATATAPSATGNFMQYLGMATSATSIAFEATDGIVM
jgi:hypothetical protein